MGQTPIYCSTVHEAATRVWSSTGLPA